MARTIRDIPKKRGRPKTTGRGLGVLVRFPSDEVASLDGWIKGDGRLLSRPQAIRSLVKRALREPQIVPGSNPGAAQEASNMAGGVIDQMADQSQSIEEQQRRKRRLLKGPSEFRDMRKK